VQPTVTWSGRRLESRSGRSSAPRRIELLVGADFDILQDEIVTEYEPDGDARFQGVLARKPEIP
jgi:hypothetical protein